MGYCTVDEVASDFKDIEFSNDSSVTTAEVESFIDQEAAFINSMINDRYITPIIEGDSPNSFLTLKRINVFLAADRVRHVLAVKTGRDASDQDTKGLRSISRQPRADLKNIRDGKSDLIDAIEKSSNIGFDVGSDKSCDDMIFNPKKQQW